MTPKQPATAAGRALLEAVPQDWHPMNYEFLADHILAIEAEAAVPTPAEPLDVDRLAQAIAFGRTFWLGGGVRTPTDAEMAETIAAEYNRLAAARPEAEAAANVTESVTSEPQGLETADREAVGDLPSVEPATGSHREGSRSPIPNTEYERGYADGLAAIDTDRLQRALNIEDLAVNGGSEEGYDYLGDAEAAARIAGAYERDERP